MVTIKDICGKIDKGAKITTSSYGETFFNKTPSDET